MVMNFTRGNEGYPLYATKLPYHSQGECAAIVSHALRSDDVVKWLFYGGLPSGGARIQESIESMSFSLDTKVSGLVFPNHLRLYPIVHKDSFLYLLGCSSTDHETCANSTFVVIDTGSKHGLEWFVSYSSGPGFEHKHLAHCMFLTTGEFVCSWIDFCERPSSGNLFEQVSSWTQIVESSSSCSSRASLQAKEIQHFLSKIQNSLKTESGLEPWLALVALLTTSPMQCSGTRFNPQGRAQGYFSVHAKLQFTRAESETQMTPSVPSLCSLCAKEVSALVAYLPKPSFRLPGVHSTLLDSDTCFERNAKRARKKSPEMRVIETDPNTALYGARAGVSIQPLAVNHDAPRSNESGEQKAASADGKSFFCPECTAGFMRKYDMRRHVRSVHRNERKYQCDLCSMRFQQRGHLDSHKLVVHQGIRKYECEFCGSRFGNISNKRSHIMYIHHNESKSKNQTRK